jgi:hypothetical protein
VVTGDVYVVTVFSEETTKSGRIMAVPRNFVFGDNVAHGTLIVIGIVVVIQRRLYIPIIIAGRCRNIARVTIPVSRAGVVGGIGRHVGCVWVNPVPVPPRTPPPWRSEVADKDDFVETLETMKPIVSTKVSVVETVKASKAQA